MPIPECVEMKQFVEMFLVLAKGLCQILRVLFPVNKMLVTIPHMASSVHGRVTTGFRPPPQSPREAGRHPLLGQPMRHSGTASRPQSPGPQCGEGTLGADGGWWKPPLTPEAVAVGRASRSGSRF